MLNNSLIEVGGLILFLSFWWKSNGDYVFRKRKISCENMVQNDLTRTIILLVSYMIKHGNDETTKEVFRWVKEHRHDTAQGLIKTIEKGLETEPV